MHKQVRFVSVLAVAALTFGWASGCLAAGTMIVHHTVASYAKWRPIFDADKKLQEDAGLTNPRVLQSVGHPNNLTLIFDMADAAKAKALVTSKELKQNMAKSGVIGKPQIFFLNAAS